MRRFSTDSLIPLCTLVVEFMMEQMNQNTCPGLVRYDSAVMMLSFLCVQLLKLNQAVEHC